MKTGEIHKEAEIWALPCPVSVGDTIEQRNKGAGVVRKTRFHVRRKNHRFRFEWRANVDLPDGGTYTAKFPASLATSPRGLVHLGSGAYGIEE